MSRDWRIRLRAEANENEAKERAKRQSDTVSQLQRNIAELNEKISRFDSQQAEEKKERKKVERDRDRLAEDNKDIKEHMKKFLKKYDELVCLSSC